MSAPVEQVGDARSLIMHPGKAPDGCSPVELAVRRARDCAKHGLALPAEDVRVLLEHVERVHGAAVTIDRFLRTCQTVALYQVDKSARVPARILRGFRNQIRAALGWSPLMKDEQP